MLKRTNAHFEKIRKQLEAYKEAKKTYEKQKQKLITTEGWESESLNALCENKPEFPISQGACKAYHAWRESVECKKADLELDCALWDNEVADFVDCLRKAGIETFVYTDQGTLVMKNLHAFAKEGCHMEGLCAIKRTEHRFGENSPEYDVFITDEEILGIRFMVC